MDFYKRMEIVCQNISKGRVVTYGQIALLCGKPRNARQVGYGLRHGLVGQNVPAHRFANSKGILSGAGYFETWDLQKLLLMDEGVKVVYTKDGWKVDLREYGWKNTMEEAETLKRMFEERGI